MSSIGLKDNVLDNIKSDPILFGKVAQVLGVVPSSLTRLLINNHPKLTQAAVLQVIKTHLEFNGETQSIEELCEMQASA